MMKREYLSARPLQIGLEVIGRKYCSERPFYRGIVLRSDDYSSNIEIKEVLNDGYYKVGDIIRIYYSHQYNRWGGLYRKGGLELGRITNWKTIIEGGGIYG